MGIAFYNLGVEFEHIKRFNEAIESYEKSLQYAKQTPYGKSLVE